MAPNKLAAPRCTPAAQLPHAATSLTKLADRVARTVRDRRQALAVITATGGYACQRPDGASVIPITTLGP